MQPFPRAPIRDYDDDLFTDQEDPSYTTSLDSNPGAVRVYGCRELGTATASSATLNAGPANSDDILPPYSSSLGSR